MYIFMFMCVYVCVYMYTLSELPNDSITKEYKA